MPPTTGCVVTRGLVRVKVCSTLPLVRPVVTQQDVSWHEYAASCTTRSFIAECVMATTFVVTLRRHNMAFCATNFVVTLRRHYLAFCATNCVMTLRRHYLASCATLCCDTEETLCGILCHHFCRDTEET